MTIPQAWEHSLNAFFTQNYDPTMAPSEIRRRRKCLTSFLLFLAERWEKYPEEPLSGRIIKRSLAAYLDAMEVDDLLERPLLASRNRLLNLATMNEFYQFVVNPMAPPSRQGRQDGPKREQGPRAIAPQLAPGDPWLTCFERFLIDRCNTEKSRETYGHNLRLFFTACGKHPADVRKPDIEAFLMQPTKSGASMSTRTRNVRLCAIRSLYKFASGYTVGESDEPIFVRPNPANGIKFRKVVAAPKGLTREEITRFFAAIDLGTEQHPNVLGWRDRALFLTFLHTAGRLSATMGLRFSDVELAMFGTGEKRRAGWRYKTVRKNSQGNYIYAELPEPAHAAIWKYLEVSGRLATMRPDSPIFIAMGPAWRPIEEERALKSGTVDYIMKKYLAAAGLPLTHSPHSWRHSSAQLRFLAGQDLFSLSKTLGHSSVVTTQIYLTGLLSDQDEGAAALARELGEL